MKGEKTMIARDNDETKMNDEIKMMLKLMEYDALSDRQHFLVISFEKQFNKRGSLSDFQFEILSDIFKWAAEQ